MTYVIYFKQAQLNNVKHISGTTDLVTVLQELKVLKDCNIDWTF